jgi:hypothetical protein
MKKEFILYLNTNFKAKHIIHVLFMMQILWTTDVYFHYLHVEIEYSQTCIYIQVWLVYMENWKHANTFVNCLYLWPWVLISLCLITFGVFLSHLTLVVRKRFAKCANKDQ